jgi:hypothetical protein
MADVELDRHYKILKRIILELPPMKDETTEETALRKELEQEVKEIIAKGQIPSIPFD